MTDWSRLKSTFAMDEEIPKELQRTVIGKISRTSEPHEVEQIALQCGATSSQARELGKKFGAQLSYSALESKRQARRGY